MHGILLLTTIVLALLHCSDPQQMEIFPASTSPYVAGRGELVTDQSETASDTYSNPPWPSSESLVSWTYLLCGWEQGISWITPLIQLDTDG